MAECQNVAILADGGSDGNPLKLGLLSRSWIDCGDTIIAQHKAANKLKNLFITPLFN